MGTYVGLRMGGGRLHGVALRIAGGRKEILGQATVEYAEGDSLAEKLEECAAALPHDSAVWVVGLPGVEFSFRHMAFPFRNSRAIASALPYEMEAVLPHPAEDMEVSFSAISSSRDETRVLACAIRKERLEFYRSELRKAGIRAQIVMPDMAALQALHFGMLPRGKEDIPSFVASLDEGAFSMCYVGGDGFVDFGLSEPEGDEITRFLASFEEKPRRIFLGGGMDRKFPASLFPAVSEWGMDVESPGPGVSPKSMMIPLGLAMRGYEGKRNHINFSTEAASAGKLSSSLRLAAACAAVCVVLWIGFLGYRNHVKEAQLEDIRERIVEVYMVAIPKGRVVKPNFQLRQKLKELGVRLKQAGLQESGRADILWVLKLISEKLPESPRVEMDEIVFGEDGMTLRGRTEGFDAVPAIREKLMSVSIFKSVDVADSKSSPDQKSVIFTIRIKL